MNKKDAVGLNRDEDIADQENNVFDENPFDTVGFFKSPFGNDDYPTDFASFDPIKLSGSGGDGNFAVEKPEYSNPYAVMYDSLFNKPKKNLSSKKDTYKYVDINPEPPRTQYSSNYDSPSSNYNDPYYDYNQGYDYSPSKDDYYSPPAADYYQPPKDDFYSPPPNDYSTPHQDDYYAPPAKPAYEPEPYYPPKPVGPVLLEKRPYEVKSVQPLPITVSESYTSFDCRDKYPGRHYADPEAGCQVRYHHHHSLIIDLLCNLRSITFATMMGSKIVSSVDMEQCLMSISAPVTIRTMSTAKLVQGTLLQLQNIIMIHILHHSNTVITSLNLINIIIIRRKRSRSLIHQILSLTFLQI